jgi:hypothetical protein
MWLETLTPHRLIVFAAKRLKSRGGALKGAHLLATRSPRKGLEFKSLDPSPQNRENGARNRSLPEKQSGT